jgi:hypothetical protein
MQSFIHKNIKYKYSFHLYRLVCCACQITSFVRLFEFIRSDPFIHTTCHIDNIQDDINESKICI